MLLYEGLGDLVDGTSVEMLILFEPASIVGMLYPGLQGCQPKANMGANLWLQGCLALGIQGRS